MTHPEQKSFSDSMASLLGKLIGLVFLVGVTVGGFYGLAWLVAMFLRLVASFR